MSQTSRPERLAHLTMLWAEATAPVTICILASSRTPDIPTGFWIPDSSSTINSWGRTWMTSRSMGMATARAASITLSTSFSVISEPLMATIPRLLKPVIWPPAIPAHTEEISHPAINSASSTAFFIDSTVDSMLMTTPLRNPMDGCVPMPMILMSDPDTSPTTAQILVVPMSRPTITSCCRCIQALLLLQKINSVL